MFQISADSAQGDGKAPRSKLAVCKHLPGILKRGEQAPSEREMTLMRLTQDVLGTNMFPWTPCECKENGALDEVHCTCGRCAPWIPLPDS